MIGFWSLILRLPLHNMPNQLSYYVRENSCHCELALSCQTTHSNQGTFTHTPRKYTGWHIFWLLFIAVLDPIGGLIVVSTIADKTGENVPILFLSSHFPLLHFHGVCVCGKKGKERGRSYITVALIFAGPFQVNLCIGSRRKKLIRC